MTDATASDGARIHADVAGDGEPLLLLAGQANSHRWWDPVRDDFAEFRTIALDTLGTGDSEAPENAEYSTRRFADDVVSLLDRLRVERAHVYGTSMGGKIAQWLAVDHPERVGALVLGCTTPGGPHAVPAERAVLASLGRPDALTALMFTPAWTREHPGPYPVLGDPGMTTAARIGHWTASAAHDAWAQVTTITAPTLVLHGGDDVFCPTVNARSLADRIPGATLHLFDGARHAYFVECRAEASLLVTRFLKAHPLGT